MDQSRVAYLEAEVRRGLEIYNRSAAVESAAYRALQNAHKHTPTLVASAADRYALAFLRADAHRTALSILTGELGYVPKPTRPT